MRSNESKYALVGASSLSPFSENGYLYQPGLNFSSDGHCKPFDQSADGLVGGEGAGVIVLKKTLDAIEDGDHIYAILRGVSLNNDGGDKVGYYAPSSKGQAAVIEKVLKATKVDPETIRYVEAHGTGTKLGDPVEVMALTDVYRRYSSKKQYCGIGSVKSNIGHLDTAAGLAGCIKVSLCLAHGEIPPSINFSKPNPDIDFENSPFYVVDHLMKWSNGSVPRRAALSSFGIGGTNTHAILEEYPSSGIGEPFRSQSRSDHDGYLIPLSAKNEERLKEAAKNLFAFLTVNSPRQKIWNLHEVAYTLQVGREAMKNRVIFVVGNLDELIEKLEGFINGNTKLRDFWKGDLRKSGDNIHFFENDEDSRELISKWIEKGKLKKLAELWIKGGNFDWNELYTEIKPQRVSLPTYPFAKKRYWIETTNKITNQGHAAGKGIQFERANKPLNFFQVTGAGSNQKITLKDPNLALKNFNLEETKSIAKEIEPDSLSNRQKQLYFEGIKLKNGEIKNTLSIADTILIREHTVFGYHVLPTDSLVEMVYEAAVKYFSSVELSFQNVYLINPIVCLDHQLTQVHLTFSRGGEAVSFEVKSYVEGDKAAFSENLRGRISPRVCSLEISGGCQRLLAEIDNAPDLQFNFDKGQPVQIGEFFRSLKKFLCYGNEAVGIIRLAEKAQPYRDQFLLHPSIFESLLATVVHLIEALPQIEGSYSIESHCFIPAYIHRLDIIKPLEDEEYYVYAKVINVEKEFIRVDAELIDDNGNVVLRLQGLDEKRITLNDIENSVQHLVDNREKGRQNEISVGEFVVESQTNLTSERDQHLNDHGECSAVLGNLLAETLLLEPAKVDINQKFIEQGLDSILGIEYIQKINKKYGLNLRGTVLYEHPTLSELSSHLWVEYPEVLRSTIDQKSDLEKPKKDGRTNCSSWESQQNTGICQQEPLSEELFAPVVLKYSPNDPSPLPISKNLRSDAGDERQIALSSFGMGKEDKIGTDLNRMRDIAIIGISARFPKSRNLEEFWHHIIQGHYLITEVPKDHWDIPPGCTADSSVSAKLYCNKGGFIDDVDKFDPLFFKISPREAEAMDPQLRHLLEVVWETVEDAGYGQSIKGSRTGMYVGNCSNEYYHRLLEGNDIDYQYLTAGSGYSDLSNRVSYVLDLNGPSLTVDTTCSSSLVALDLACESLRNQKTEMCLVGGVNLSLSSAKYLSFCAMSAFSKKSVITPFDENADGYIPSEGIACVLLKPLVEALQDKDHVYGVVKGIGITHGGFSGGPTIPNPKQQTQVMLNAWEDAKINPETISYYEAHGTGTQVGDPLEINALKKAFAQYTQKTEYCYLGTVKANIGHTEATAGLAGVIKVLLMMKHRQIPLLPKLNKLNPMIELENTPFLINQDNQEWRNTGSTARRAGVSSFGMGGTFAHVVIEEYVEKENGEDRYQNIEDKAPYLIVLSAKTEDRLKVYAQRFYKYFTDDCPLSTDNLRDVAYTLQAGREPMKERLAMIVRSFHELEIKLKGFIEGRHGIEDLYRGQVNRTEETLEVFGADEELQEAMEKWFHRGKYSSLLNLWVKGLVIDWNKLYGKSKPRRISLPTYPFVKERHWIPQLTTKHRETDAPFGSQRSTRGVATIQHPASSNQLQASRLHPLVHENTSNFEEHRFSSTFTGEEFFLTNHLAKSEKVLLEVAYLEMARTTVEKAAGSLVRDQTGIQLNNVVWARPLVVNSHPQEVHIRLFPEVNGQVQYEIYSEVENSEQELVVHSQGVANPHGIDKLPSLDLSGLRAIMNQGYLTSRECYHAYGTMGIDNPCSQQGLESIYTGINQALAKISLPSSALITLNQFILHPSVMNSALQACSVLIGNRSKKLSVNQRLFLPIALQELEILSPFTTPMWAWIRYSATSKSADKGKELDVDLCDDQGQVCAKMKGFSCQVVDGERKPIETTGILTCRPVWKEQEVPKETRLQEFGDHLVMLCELNVPSRNPIGTEMPGIRCLTIKSEAQEVANRFQAYVLRIFEEIQTLFRTKLKPKVLIQIVVPLNNEQQLFSGISALLKTAHLENPKIVGQFIETDPGETKVGLLNKLRENSRCPEDADIRYQNGKRYVKKFQEVDPEIGSSTPALQYSETPLRQNGVYLITGGTGKLGLIFANEIARTTKDSTLILAGRSGLSREKQDQLNKLMRDGARVEYRQVDVSQRKAAEDLVQGIVADFGGINGILHSAGVIHDNFILKKTAKEFREVLASKVTGTTFLDQATQNLNLDFFVFFSSGSGAVGNAGQADYSAANAFMDAYAVYRNSLVTSKKRQGQTLSINWPLWKNGGMRVDEATEKMMVKRMGLMAMETSSGIRALFRALSSNQSQMMVLVGDLPRLKQRFLEGKSKVESYPIKKSIVSVEKNVLKKKTLHQLKRLLGEVIKLSADRIESNEPLESYGIDSIVITQLNERLEILFGEISATLFFEYQTLGDLAEYFIAEYPETCMAWIGAELWTFPRPERPSPAELLDGEFPVLAPIQSNAKGNGRFIIERPNSRVQKPIAIIGMSGRYPQAKNMEEYWKLLEAGKNCISEIPQDRWSLEGFYYSDQEQAVAIGKSYNKWGGFLDGFAEFDPLFFNISPREAMTMDPQERLFVETCWETLEDAGYTRAQLQEQFDHRVGVFAGITKTGFDLYGPGLWKTGENILPHTSFSSVANRVSYVLNLQGPSMPIDTMCSSSLTAIHEACEHLHCEDCKLALAGGVNLYLHPSTYVALCATKMLSRDGKCKSFGEGADGMVPGEGVGVILLKPFSQAVVDNDHIYAVIRGSSVNHGGKTNGYTVPNPKAQAHLITETLEKAGINARTLSYIEAHGTGTELGDPIEITGLTQAFQKDTSDIGFCALGSSKSNLGHLEAAAGIAGLSKIILQLKYGQLAPSLHVNETNPKIDFEKTPFVVQKTLSEWKRPRVKLNGELKEYPRIAGISSFGAGGSNAHVIIEEYVNNGSGVRGHSSRLENNDPCLIVLSAKNEERLKVVAKNLHEFIKQQILNSKSEILNLNDLAYTLQVGREPMEERLAMIVRSLKEVKEKLKSFAEGQNDIEDLYRGQVKGNKDTLALFAADEEMAKTIDAWITNRKYSKLLELWVKGLAYDWDKLYGELRPCRISLPTYPFTQNRYWLQKTNGQKKFSPIKQKTNGEFNEKFYSELLDELSKNRISIKDAAQKI